MSILLTRRSALGMLAAAPLAAQKTDLPLSFTNLDHVEFFASDVVKSVAFYARIFGNNVLKNNKTTRRYVNLGSAYIAIETAGQAGIRVDHFCAGMPGFKVSEAHTYLTAHGVEYKDFPSGKDLAVADPDGTRLQMASDNGWNLLTASTASPESIPGGDPIFPGLRNCRKAEGRVVEWESVVECNPDLIFASWCGMKVDVEEIRSRPRANEITAVRLGRIYEISSSLILQPGPAALTEGVGQLHALLAKVASGAD